VARLGFLEEATSIGAAIPPLRAAEARPAGQAIDQVPPIGYHSGQV
jgi:hypothetical protein